MEELNCFKKDLKIAVLKKEYFILSDLKYYTFFYLFPFEADLKCKAKLGRFLERRMQHLKNPLKKL